MWNKCAMIYIEVNLMEHEYENETTQPETEGYAPRPAWQVWAARIGLMLFILVIILYYIQIARGGL